MRGEAVAMLKQRAREITVPAASWQAKLRSLEQSLSFVSTACHHNDPWLCFRAGVLSGCSRTPEWSAGKPDRS